MARDTDYIFAFIDKHENTVRGGHPVGYIPKKGNVILGKSGVTIATGCDLGQQDINSLRKYKVPEALILKLSPYLKLQTTHAEAKLDEKPLVLSKEECKTLTRCIINGYLEKTAMHFDDLARPAGARLFDDVPREIQAVAVSMEYQLGGGAKKYFTPLASGNYKAAIDLLLADAGQYEARRHNEGETAWTGYVYILAEEMRRIMQLTQQMEEKMREERIEKALEKAGENIKNRELEIRSR